jgi:hypothetical protein
MPGREHLANERASRPANPDGHQRLDPVANELVPVGDVDRVAGDGLVVDEGVRLGVATSASRARRSIAAREDRQIHGRRSIVRPTRIAVRSPSAVWIESAPLEQTLTPVLLLPWLTPHERGRRGQDLAGPRALEPEPTGHRHGTSPAIRCVPSARRMAHGVHLARDGTRPRHDEHAECAMRPRTTRRDCLVCGRRSSRFISTESNERDVSQPIEYGERS